MLDAHFLHVSIDMSHTAQALGVEQTEDAGALRGQDLNDRCVLVVVDVDVALDALLNARLLGRLEYVRVVEMLHGL